MIESKEKFKVLLLDYPTLPKVHEDGVYAASHSEELRAFSKVLSARKIICMSVEYNWHQHSFYYSVSIKTPTIKGYQPEMEYTFSSAPDESLLKEILQKLSVTANVSEFIQYLLLHLGTPLFYGKINLDAYIEKE